ncbi:MAG TPA: flagellar assembly protein FliW [Bryobacteraceae bacterium]|nr:flagellar assembly protein FliW [Bryobacteraceae bacterium]
MPSIRTKCFHQVEYTDSSLYQFPHGLPGFEQERAFLFLNRPDSHPLMFMQSIATPELCFILLPVFAVDPEYQLSLDDEALAQLQFQSAGQPKIGRDILCAVIVCTRANQEPPTVNLLAPIVVNLRERIGIQVIQTQSGYSHQHPLVPVEEMAPCS